MAVVEERQPRWIEHAVEREIPRVSVLVGDQEVEDDGAGGEERFFRHDLWDVGRWERVAGLADVE